MSAAVSPDEAPTRTGSDDPLPIHSYCMPCNQDQPVPTALCGHVPADWVHPRPHDVRCTDCELLDRCPTCGASR